jgi:hypothetical protein
MLLYRGHFVTIGYDMYPESHIIWGHWPYS